MRIDGLLDSPIVWAPVYRLGPTVLINMAYVELLTPQPRSLMLSHLVSALP